ncbi:hypothetical protein AB0E69_07290 [Kribbella sp. NPDC026611]|uniref:hypothetical protein n=1 Tax=Kribbella sp. NPDC026611 TaxID=3154911 RepID=UPI0033C34FBC
MSQPVLPVQTEAPEAPAPWVELPRPDTSSLRGARSKAVTKLVWRIAFTTIAVVAFIAYQVTIESNVASFGSSAEQVYSVGIIVLAAILGIRVLQGLGAVRRASAAIASFERPYLAARAAEKERHQRAVAQWQEAVRRHQAQSWEAEQEAERRARGPLWYPVQPISDPVRVDVFGGDPRRHGWASLAVTLGAASLSQGQRITVIDFTGQQVGGGLARVAAAGGRRTRVVELGEGGRSVDLLNSVVPAQLPECIATALAPRAEGSDMRHERALVTQTVRIVAGCLEWPFTFARLAAGVQVLLQGSASRELTDLETSRLAEHIGDIDQNEWTTRQLRYLGSQLANLAAVLPGGVTADPLWSPDDVSVLATAGGRDDLKDVLDHLVLQLAQCALGGSRRLGDVLVVAGADHLGAETLRIFAEHARNAKVRLVLMIDQPQGDLEKTAGTGGAVCIMKMYNHRDANIAAEFIGKGYKFVLHQVSRQVGKTMTDGSSDSFTANTSRGSSTKQRLIRGPGTDLNDNRGHSWTGGRNWSTADNISTTTASSRVYEFEVEPSQIMGLPETMYLLVDNSGHGRRVIMVDANPGICLFDRVSLTPA